MVIKKKDRLPYLKIRFGNDKDKAWLLKEAKRLRETGRVNAKVLRSRKPYDKYKWTLWTQRIA